MTTAKSGLAARTIPSCKRSTSACLLQPEETQGPYYWNTTTVRSNITYALHSALVPPSPLLSNSLLSSEGKEGIPLTLKLTVVSVSDCSAIYNASVDLWHCDALGMYSHYTAAGPGGLSDASPSTDNTTFLRGIQFTDENGLATFQTIFPGHYVSRDTHIHLIVHINGTTIHTGQLFFNDSLNDAVNALSPYNTNPDTRTELADDSVYTGTENASYGLLEDVQFVDSSASYSGGLVASLTLGVSASSTSTSPSPSPTGGQSSTSPTESSGSRLRSSLSFLL
jgi:protocatechuate 3,4-dioxygenase beta subunit